MTTQEQRTIYILYKQADKEHVFAFKSDIENIIGRECCTATAIEEVKNDDHSFVIDDCKVFILMYSSHFSNIDSFERCWLTKQIESISSNENRHIVLIALDTLEVLDWIENILPRQQVTQVSNKRAINVLYYTLQNRIRLNTIDRINALPKEIFKVGDLYYRAVPDEPSVEVVSESGDDIPNERRNLGHKEVTQSTRFEEVIQFIPTHEVVIPSSIKYGKYEYDVIGIGKYAFCRCVGYETVAIPETVRYIDVGAFSDSTLRTITIPDSVTRIERHAFSDCSMLSDIRLPSYLKSLEECLFKDCRKLSSIIIPDSVETIHTGVLSGCERLKLVTIPKNVRNIEGGMFNEFIDTIIVDVNNSVYDSRDNCNAVIETATSTMIVGCNTSTIPPNIICVGNDVLSQNRGLESIILSDGILRINRHAFFGCWKLKSVVLPDSVLLIEDEAFAYCDNLASVTLGRNILRIGTRAFYNVSYYTNDDINRLPTIYVPKGLKDKYLKMLHRDFKDKVVEL